MPLKIKNKIEKELKEYSKNLQKEYSLDKISPLLSRYIKDFILRKGKRVRPILFCIGYRGFSKKNPPGLYLSAISIELLHDFMLVHDDIIDKSDTRRGRPALHKMFNQYLAKYKGAKFSGQDLAIVAGDVMFAMGIDTFLSIRENPLRKEKALRQLIRAALYTGSGEFIELLAGIKDLSKITKSDIYKIYDYKTAYYTFASPLAIGAILAGADKSEVEKLIRYGICLGRAFQVKDDILGMFADEKTIGKSGLADLQEAKKTLLVWYAYIHSGNKDKLKIRKIFSKANAARKDLLKMRQIIVRAQALDYARREVSTCLKEAQDMLNHSKMHTKYKNILSQFAAQILKL